MCHPLTVSFGSYSLKIIFVGPLRPALKVAYLPGVKKRNSNNNKKTKTKKNIKNQEQKRTKKGIKNKKGIYKKEKKHTSRAYMHACKHSAFTSKPYSHCLPACTYLTNWPEKLQAGVLKVLNVLFSTVPEENSIILRCWVMFHRWGRSMLLDTKNNDASKKYGKIKNKK